MRVKRDQTRVKNCLRVIFSQSRLTFWKRVFVHRVGGPCTEGSLHRNAPKFKESGLLLQKSVGFRFWWEPATLKKVPKRRERGLISTATLDLAYKGTSLKRNTPLLEPYSRSIPWVIWWSWGGMGGSYERNTPAGGFGRNRIRHVHVNGGTFALYLLLECFWKNDIDKAYLQGISTTLMEHPPRSAADPCPKPYFTFLKPHYNLH